jgi:hypothetical protein
MPDKVLRRSLIALLVLLGGCAGRTGEPVFASIKATPVRAEPARLHPGEAIYLRIASLRNRYSGFNWKKDSFVVSLVGETDIGRRAPSSLIVHNHATERTRGKKTRETPIFLTTSDRKSVRAMGWPSQRPDLRRRWSSGDVQMKAPFLGRYPASPWLQAHAALLGGLTYIGAAGAAVAAAASRGTLAEETVIAASTGVASGLIGVLGIASAHQMRRAGRRSANKVAAIAVVTALAACAAPAPSWSAAPPSGSPLFGRTSGPAFDCSDYDNSFTTPDAVKLPLGVCRRQ